MPFATCPQCDDRVRFAELPDVGDIVHCRTCDARLEVISLNPIELDWPFELDDDDEDETDDESGFAVFPEASDDDDDDEDDDGDAEDVF
jgi:lysine biosynthesis protein LysW